MHKYTISKNSKFKNKSKKLIRNGFMNENDEITFEKIEKMRLSTRKANQWIKIYKIK